MKKECFEWEIGDREEGGRCGRIQYSVCKTILTLMVGFLDV